MKEEQAECEDHHQRWYDSYVRPQILLTVGTMLVASLGVASGVFFYLSRNAIRDFDLQARDTYVTMRSHQGDIARIEQRIERLESSVTHSLSLVGEKLDRNYDALTKVGKR